MTLRATIGLGDDTRDISLEVRWPDLEDEELIDRRTAEILMYPAQNMPEAAQYLARGRAMIEVLAVSPYPQFLHRTLTGQKPVNHKGKTELRPNTNLLQSRAGVAQLYSDFVEKYSRFQYLAV
jgi:hypothetical protein